MIRIALLAVLFLSPLAALHAADAINTDDGSPNGRPIVSRQVDEWELFELKSDPDERTNHYNRPEVQGTVTELKTELDRLRRELKGQN